MKHLLRLIITVLTFLGIAVVASLLTTGTYRLEKTTVGILLIVSVAVWGITEVNNWVEKYLPLVLFRKYLPTALF